MKLGKGDLMLLIGRRLKKLRLENKMTQEELAKQLNLSKVTISCYENNSRTPSLETLLLICDIFNVDLPTLIGRETYAINEEINPYQAVRMSQEEMNLVKELRNHPDLYQKISSDPKRMIELIKKKLN